MKCQVTFVGRKTGEQTPYYTALTVPATTKQDAMERIQDEYIVQRFVTFTFMLERPKLNEKEVTTQMLEALAVDIK